MRFGNECRGFAPLLRRSGGGWMCRDDAMDQATTVGGFVADPVTGRIHWVRRSTAQVTFRSSMPLILSASTKSVRRTAIAYCGTISLKR